MRSLFAPTFSFIHLFQFKLLKTITGEHWSPTHLVFKVSVIRSSQKSNICLVPPLVVTICFFFFLFLLKYHFEACLVFIYNYKWQKYTKRWTWINIQCIYKKSWVSRQEIFRFYPQFFIITGTILPVLSSCNVPDL